MVGEMIIKKYEPDKEEEKPSKIAELRNPTVKRSSLEQYRTRRPSYERRRKDNFASNLVGYSHIGRVDKTVLEGIK